MRLGIYFKLRTITFADYFVIQDLTNYVKLSKKK
jgi:hypothetical protein